MARSETEDYIFVVAAVVALAGAVVAVVLVRNRDFIRHNAPDAPAAPPGDLTEFGGEHAAAMA